MGNRGESMSSLPHPSVRYTPVKCAVMLIVW